MEGESSNAATDQLADRTCFLLLVGSDWGERHARLLIESLRTFGGELSDCPVWVFLADPDGVPGSTLDIKGVRCIPLVREDELQPYIFADKVRACAQAERMADGNVHSLVWFSLTTLIVGPPVLFDLAPAFDAAFRPVHHRNIGSLAAEPLDDFWSGVYRAVGLEDAPFTVESYVDSLQLRPYFNTHMFAVDPSLGLLRKWWELFQGLVTDDEFQSGPCADRPHQIFLHQAVLSGLVAKMMGLERICILPPEYSYPLHLHQEVVPALRPQKLNNLVCPVYEQEYRYPETLSGIEVDEPLRSWLAACTPVEKDDQ